MKKYYSDLQINHLCNTEQYLVVGKVLSDLNTVLSEHYENLWHTRVKRVESIRGPGRNKLRTYKIFKQNITAEHYLLLYNKKYRSVMAKFMAGDALLRLETGRYDNTDEADQVCFQSPDIIESEEHVILHCPLYDDLRKVIFDHAENVNPDFINMMSEENLYFF